MKNKKKLIFKIIFIIILIVLFIILGLCIKNIYNSLNKKTEVKTLSEIKNYDYIVNENDPPYFGEVFKKLKKCLEQDEIDEEEYAKLVSELFVIDFYSLNYSLSKSDIGGLQFVISDNRDSFTNKAKDTIYNYVESNIYGKRKQELPNVKEVEIISIKKSEYEGELYQDDEAYYVDLNISYEKDLEYPTEVSIVLIHNNNKLEIVKVD